MYGCNTDRLCRQQGTLSQKSRRLLVGRQSAREVRLNRNAFGRVQDQRELVRCRAGNDVEQAPGSAIQRV